MRIASLLCVVPMLIGLVGCRGSDAVSAMHADLNKTAYLMMRVPASPVAYTIHLALFDDLAGILEPYRYKDELLRVDPTPVATYVAVDVPPGIYVISSLFQQDHWGVCFYNESRSFSVFAAEAVFLGDFQPKAHLDQIERLAAQSGATTVGGLTRVVFRDGIIPPQITAPTANSPDFLAAKQYEASSLPMLTGHLKPVVYSPAHFRNGDPNC